MCVCVCACISVYACMFYRNVPFPRRLYTILRKKNHAYIRAGSWWPNVNFLIPLVSENRCTGSTELSSLHNVLLRIMRFVPTSTSVACHCVQDSRCVCFFCFYARIVTSWNQGVHCSWYCFIWLEIRQRVNISFLFDVWMIYGWRGIL